MSDQDLSMTSSYDLDKVLFSDFSFSDSGPGAAFSKIGAGGLVGVGLGGPILPIGVFKLATDNVWRDCASINLSGGFTMEPANFVLTYSTGYTIYTEYRGVSSIQADGRLAALAVVGGEYDLSVCAYADNPSYDSAVAFPKVVLENTFSVSSASTQTTTINHNLGYVPTCIVWYKITQTSGDLGWELMPTSLNSSGNGDGIIIDENQLIIKTNSRSPTITLEVYYKIYTES